MMLSKHPAFDTNRQILLRLKRNYFHRSTSMPLYLGSVEIPMGANYLLSLLPEREDCDRLTELYFDTYGGIYDIVHQPSFDANTRNYGKIMNPLNILLFHLSY